MLPTTTVTALHSKSMVTKMTSTQTRWLYPLSFFIFISYIIFLADTADYNFAFHMVGQIPYGDKMCHALLYGVMALLLNYGLGFRYIQYKNISVGCCPPTTPTLNTKYLTIWSNIKRCCKGTTPYKFHIQLGSIIVLIFVTLEECSQYFIPSRTFALWDLGADFIGVVLFSMIRVKR